VDGAGIRKATSGWEVVALSAWTRWSTRVAAFQEVSQEVGAKVRDVARRCLYSGPGASGLSRQDHRREPDNPVLLEVRQTDVAGLRAIEHDEDVRSEQGNKEDWKNDKMVRGCALRQSVRCLIDRDSRGHEHHGLGGRGRPCPPTTHDKRVEGEEDPTVLRECASSESTGSKLTTTSHIAITQISRL
jgi:hypothetical protein